MAGNKNSGRRRGDINKEKKEFREMLDEYCIQKGVDPHLFFVDVLANPTVKMSYKLFAAKELAQYKQPKLRAMNISGEDGGPIKLEIEMVNYVEDTTAP